MRVPGAHLRAWVSPVLTHDGHWSPHFPENQTRSPTQEVTTDPAQAPGESGSQKTGGARLCRPGLDLGQEEPIRSLTWLSESSNHDGSNHPAFIFHPTKGTCEKVLDWLIWGSGTPIDISEDPGTFPVSDLPVSAHPSSSLPKLG